ncbi:hypothetical protein ZWY2020_042064 [Hordeum vulgare]|nr:hypothetical protein ZWY2020_042064 [Hordeum vulgare]
MKSQFHLFRTSLMFRDISKRLRRLASKPLSILPLNYRVVIEACMSDKEDEAKEKAAQVALECMCAYYNIFINDHNNYALEVTKERLFREKHAREKVAKQNEFTSQTMILAKVCYNFTNVLPLHIYSQCPHSEDPIITYTGAYPPLGHVQEFAKDLYHFITRTNFA